ncbi:MAG: hypothetical protein KDA87_01005 [Planctomycetales bacterium]|nr:hypothetical protein [Planctomycetales bacterium]
MRIFSLAVIGLSLGLLGCSSQTADSLPDQPTAPVVELQVPEEVARQVSKSLAHCQAMVQKLQEGSVEFEKHPGDQAAWSEIQKLTKEVSRQTNEALDQLEGLPAPAAAAVDSLKAAIETVIAQIGEEIPAFAPVNEQFDALAKQFAIQIPADSPWPEKLEALAEPLDGVKRAIAVRDAWHADARAFTDTLGQRYTAKLVAVSGPAGNRSITLERENGSVFAISAGRLSDGDQAYIEEWAETHATDADQGFGRGSAE